MTASIVENRAAQAARWLAEAMESGDPLGLLPPEIAPRDLDEAAAVAAATLDALDIVPCGLRLLRRVDAAALAGPMIEGRLLRSPSPVATGALRHPLASAAAIGVLAAPLRPEETTPPEFERIHPALDISATRFSQAPEDELALTADLARLGLVVAGKGKAVAPGVLRVGLGPKGARARGVELDLAAAFADAAAAARAWGGLPAGALLVAAGLTAPVPAEGTLRASLGTLGAAEATFG
jgi:hypothetical protein